MCNGSHDTPEVATVVIFVYSLTSRTAIYSVSGIYMEPEPEGLQEVAFPLVFTETVKVICYRWKRLCKRVVCFWIIIFKHPNYIQASKLKHGHLQLMRIP